MNRAESTRLKVKDDEMKKGLTALIDWVQVTFLKLNAYEIMEHILKFDKSMMSHECRGLNGYVERFYFSNIIILVPSADREDMGCHLLMSGSACRELEVYLNGQGRTWYDFLGDCLNYGGNFTRLDIAIDDRKTYFNIKTLGRKVAKKECVSGFKDWGFISGGSIGGERGGNTLNLGSRGSKCSMVFYEKNYEQSKKTGVPAEFYGAWNRYEVRLRAERATKCVEKMVRYHSVGFIGMGIINDYVRFVVKNDKNEQRTRWDTWKPWERFLAGVGSIKLVVRPAPQTLERKRAWIRDFIAPTLKMIQYADEYLTEDFLNEIVNEVILTPKQINIVQDYLIMRAEEESLAEEEKGELEGIVALQKSGLIMHEKLKSPF